MVCGDLDLELGSILTASTCTFVALNTDPWYSDSTVNTQCLGPSPFEAIFVGAFTTL